VAWLRANWIMLGEIRRARTPDHNRRRSLSPPATEPAPARIPLIMVGRLKRALGLSNQPCPDQFFLLAAPDPLAVRHCTRDKAYGQQVSRV
jgi:hypothetical protein